MGEGGLTSRVSLPSRIESIDEAAEVAERAIRQLRFSEDALFEILLSVREAIANAVVHGNRQNEALPIELGVASTEDQLVVTVRDHGAGFDPSTLRDATAVENILKPSGRGILLMRTFMEDVAWEKVADGGTLVTMTRSL